VIPASAKSLPPQHIIAAVDFSLASAAALAIACEVARTFRASLTILHIFEYVVQHAYTIPVDWMVSTIRKELTEKLNDAKRTAAQAGILNATTVMLDGGIPSEAILSVLRRSPRALAVIGTHATGGMERFLLGSTAEDVLRRAECPVITVGPHVQCNVGVKPCFRKVLFATDFSDASLAAIPLTVAVRAFSPAAMRVLHVSQNANYKSAEEEERFAAVHQALAAAAASRPATPDEYVLLHGSDVSQAVVNEAERYGADLIVLGVRRASAFTPHLAPRIAFQTIAAAPCPVLTMSS